MSASIPTYDPTGPLLRGRTLIEASAGTGKTYQITNLVLRLVAEEGLRVENLLVVTFTNAATAELRDRVRKRLAEAERAMSEVLRGEPAPSAVKDGVLAALCTATPDILTARRDAVALAIEEFDAAAIHTIHGFCRTVLRQHAFATGIDLERELIDSTKHVLEEIVDDGLTNTLHDMTLEEVQHAIDEWHFTRDHLLSVCGTYAGSIGAELRPLPFVLPDDWEAQVAAFGQAWETGGRDSVVAQLRVLRKTNPPKGQKYGFKKDGSPTKHFLNRLDAVSACLSGPDPARALALMKTYQHPMQRP